MKFWLPLWPGRWGSSLMSKVISVLRGTFLVPLLGLAIVLVQIQPAFSQSRAQTGDVIRLRSDVPDTYVVVRGDTLWDISAEFLENPFLWPRVWQVNPQIDNPDLIYPGDIISLVYDSEGQPRLQLERGDMAGRTDLPVIRLEPRVRREPLSGGVGQIALDRISALLGETLIIDESELDNAAYILETESGALLSGSGDNIYARGDWIEGINSYDVIRPKQVYTIPGSREKVGIEVDRVAEARIVRRDGDIATLRIEDSRQEVRLSDRLIVREASAIPSGYQPEVPAFSVNGALLGFEDGASVGGANASVIMAVGREQGVEPGHLLSLQHPSKQVRDEVRRENVTIDGTKFGRVLVYRVFDKASVGLIIESDDAVRLTDTVTSD